MADELRRGRSIARYPTLTGLILAGAIGACAGDAEVDSAPPPGVAAIDAAIPDAAPLPDGGIDAIGPAGVPAEDAGPHGAR
jgi:hypothetical protein